MRLKNIKFTKVTIDSSLIGNEYKFLMSISELKNTYLKLDMSSTNKSLQKSVLTY